MNYDKKANSALFTLIIMFIVMTIGYVVLNKSETTTRNILIGKNNQEILGEIYKKGDLALKMSKKYNSNGGNKFGDTISCPEELTVFYEKKDVSGNYNFINESSGSLIDYDGTNFFCKSYFPSLTNEMKIYFSTGVNENYFSKIDIDGIEKDLEFKNKKIVKNNNFSSINFSSNFSSNKNYLIDGNQSTFVKSDVFGKKIINFSYANSQNISHILIKKPQNFKFSYKCELEFENGEKVISNTKNFLKGEEEQKIDLGLKSFGENKKIKSITLGTTNPYDIFFISEIEFYVFEDEGTFSYGGKNYNNLIWTNQGEFYNGNEENKIKKVIFTTKGTTGIDSINDNFDSDNYRITSSGSLRYPGGYIDDDVIARLNIFGELKPNSKYYNIFWNNYKTNEIIEKNLNNNDYVYEKASNSSKAILYLDFITNNADYNIKLLKFKTGSLKNNGTFDIDKIYKGSSNFASGAIILDEINRVISIGDKTNATLFDLKNSDFAIFLENKDSNFLNYKLSATNNFGTGIYISPINDSLTGTIKVLSNHLIKGNYGNYFGNNKIIETDK